MISLKLVGSTERKKVLDHVKLAKLRTGVNVKGLMLLRSHPSHCLLAKVSSLLLSIHSFNRHGIQRVDVVVDQWMQIKGLARSFLRNRNFEARHRVVSFWSEVFTRIP